MSSRDRSFNYLFHTDTNRRLIGLIAVLAMLIAATIAIPGGALSPTPADAGSHAPATNAIEQHFAWNPNTGAWSTGQPKDYTEGETAPFRVLVNSFALPNTDYFTNVCLEIDAGGGSYAFTGFEDWDITYGGSVTAPTTGEVGPGSGPFQGVGLQVTAHQILGIGDSGCPTDFLAAYVEFTMDGDSANGPEGSAGAIVYGGHIAAAGDPLPGGGTVPSGGGAGSISGVFQAAMGDGSGGNKTVNFKGSDIIPLAPEIDIEKATNGEDADTAPGPYIREGDPVTWSYVVTNIGSTDLVDVVVGDTREGDITCPKDTLAAGESMTCELEGVAGVGQYSNIAVAVGGDSFGATATDEDPSHYFGAQGILDIEKATNGQDADSPTGPFVPLGDPVTWTYVVTNNGNTTVTDIAVVDDKVGPITCPSTELAPGADMTCTANGTAVAGQYANTGSVTGTDAASTAVGDVDNSHYFGRTTLE
jgi:hypothetical protein